MKKYDLPVDYRTEIVNGQKVEVRVYALSQRNRKKLRMTKSYRTFKREPMTMSEMRQEGFCK